MSYTGIAPVAGYPYAAAQPQYIVPQQQVRPAYIIPLQQPAPVAQPAYLVPQQQVPAYLMPQRPAYAVPQQPAYGYPQQPAYGASPYASLYGAQQPAFGYAAPQAKSPYNAAYATATGFSANTPSAASLSPFTPLSTLVANNQQQNNNSQQSSVFSNVQPSFGGLAQPAASPFAAAPAYTGYAANPLASLYTQPTLGGYGASPQLATLYGQAPASPYGSYGAQAQNPLAALFGQSAAPAYGGYGAQAQNPLAALFGQGATPSFSSTPINGTNILPIILRQPAAQAPAQNSGNDMMAQMLQMLLLSSLLDGDNGSSVTQAVTEPPINWNDVSNWLNGNNASGNVWGDPHFKDLTNTAASKTAIDYDVMGKNGQVYSMISDKNIQFNSKFKAWGRDDITVNGTAAFKLKADDGKEYRVMLDADKDTPTIDGVAMKDGETKSLKINGKDASILFKDKKLTVTTSEYLIEAQDKGSHLDYEVKVQKDGVFSDKVNPHGLLGQTADGDANLRTGKRGAGAQGEGAIDLKVTDYEVKDLFDDPKAFINRYGVKTRAVGDDKGNVKAVYDDKDNLIAAKDKDGKLVSVRRIDDGKGGTKQTLADGKTEVDNKGNIKADTAK